MATHEEEHVLNLINSPADLRSLPQNKLTQVCDELRQHILDVLSNTPGHLGSSLGTVELTIALHYVFNTPEDRIVWDVGHQAYGHKILTGRRDSFHTLRQFKGISGFPNPTESEYDAFIGGHASNSISAALGMSVASLIKEELNRHVIAVIGDGSMTGGLAYEGLNNASSNLNNLLIILNDNDMAIDESVGGLSKHLVNITTSQAYNKIRYNLYNKLRKMNWISEKGRETILRFNNSLKALINRRHNLFEGFSIRYFGPINGHDVEDLIDKLKDIKDMQGPKLLHIKTIKGKGFKPAEESATEWHAPGRFDKETGKRIIPERLDEPQLYQDVFGHTLVELAEKDERIVGITPAMPSGCSMNFLMKAFPKRAFDVGIAESHAVTFSAGLAKEGMIPFCNIYSSFMQRAYDQIIHDVAIMKLHVVMCLDRGGLVGEDGATHHGVFDLAYLRAIPNLTIASPLNELDLRNLMYTGYQFSGPFVIRYPRGKGELKDWQNKMETLPIGKGKKLKDGKQLAILSIGAIGNEVIKAIQIAEQQGLSIAHYDMIYLKPIDTSILEEIGKTFPKIITVENGTTVGGLGSAVSEYMTDNNFAIQVKRLGVPDQFIEHGTIPELYQFCEMDAASIAKTILTLTALPEILETQSISNQSNIVSTPIKPL